MFDVVKFLATRFVYACFYVFLIFVGFVIASRESSRALEDLRATKVSNEDHILKCHKAIVQLEDEVAMLRDREAKRAIEVNMLQKKLYNASEQTTREPQAEIGITKAISAKIADDLKQREFSFFGQLFGF